MQCEAGRHGTRSPRRRARPRRHFRSTRPPTGRPFPRSPVAGRSSSPRYRRSPTRPPFPTRCRRCRRPAAAQGARRATLQRQQVCLEVRELIGRQMRRLPVLVVGISRRQHVHQRRRAAVVQVRRRRPHAEHCRRVDPRQLPAQAHPAARAERADVVQHEVRHVVGHLAVGERRRNVALGARRLFREEDVVAAPRHLGQLAVRPAKRARRWGLETAHVGGQRVEVLAAAAVGHRVQRRMRLLPVAEQPLPAESILDVVLEVLDLVEVRAPSAPARGRCRRAPADRSCCAAPRRPA